MGRQTSSWGGTWTFESAFLADKPSPVRLTAGDFTVYLIEVNSWWIEIGTTSTISNLQGGIGTDTREHFFWQLDKLVVVQSPTENANQWSVSCVGAHFSWGFGVCLCVCGGGGWRGGGVITIGITWKGLVFVQHSSTEKGQFLDKSRLFLNTM